MSKLEVYMAKFYKDRELKGSYDLPDWMHPIQVGAALTEQRVADVLDCDGDNISRKNVNYCELTALYWIWKNCLNRNGACECDGQESSLYYGLFHYRRILDISNEDIKRMLDNDVDVVLPFPTVHEPNIKEHPLRYIRETDWNAALQALKELQPEYYSAYEQVAAQQYLYNYNILVAKGDVLKQYCEWLFPILERTEELSVPRGRDRSDRYIGYIGENLLTIYFMHNANNLNIACTGRIMLV